MKTRDFERLLTETGFSLVRLSSHRVWSNGVQQVAVPQGKEISRMVARRLLKEIKYQGQVHELKYVG